MRSAYRVLAYIIAAEVAIALQRLDAHLIWVGNVVLVRVALVLQVDRLLGVVLTEEVGVLTLVTSGDQLLQTQLLEVVREVVEKVADAGVIAV